jgi:hypothetical protein
LWWWGGFWEELVYGNLGGGMDENENEFRALKVCGWLCWDSCGVAFSLLFGFALFVLFGLLLPRKGFRLMIAGFVVLVVLMSFFTFFPFFYFFRCVLYSPLIPPLHHVFISDVASLFSVVRFPRQRV